MEIVSRPDLRSAREAQAYVTSAHILRYPAPVTRHGQGNLRADVKCRYQPGDPLGPRSRDQERKLDPLHRPSGRHATRRQIGISRRRHDRQETRLFDPSKGDTRSRRSKKSARYRYFPDPDLLPLSSNRAVSMRSQGSSGATGRQARAFLTTMALLLHATVLVAEREAQDSSRRWPRHRRHFRQLGEQRAVRRLNKRQ